MGKPNCYGDSDYYSETSRICNACGYRADCKAQVNKDAQRNWSTPSKTTKTKQTNGAIGPIMPTGSSHLGVGHSVYNHGDALAPQFMRYVAFSIFESTLEESRVLVQSMRNNYTQQQIQASTPLVEIAEPKEK